jgi:probable HAF family extracellular repeat protein
MIWPIGLNNLNDIVSDGRILDLDTGASTIVLPAGGYPVPRLQAINDNGIAVGYSECACSNSNRTVQTALLWDGASHTIPVPAAKELLRINNANVVVGNIRGTSAGSEGFVYDVNAETWVNLTDLLPLSPYGRGRSELHDINESNVVTGRGWDGQFVRGLIWSASEGFTYLPALPGGLVDRVYPRGINANGTVVGFADMTPHVPHAFVWTHDGGMRDLNDLVTPPPGFILDWALKINDQGWIIGVGHYGPTWGTARGFVLRPKGAVTSDASADFASALRVTPNPARSDLVLSFMLPQAAPVRLSIFDVSGRRLVTVLDRNVAAGTHAINWRTDAAPASGVYYAKLESAGRTRVERFVVVR